MSTYTLFISHAQDDLSIALLARDEEERRGGRPYLAAARELPTLDRPAEDLSRELRNSDRLLVVWSISAANAWWVLAEWSAFLLITKDAARCEVLALDGTPIPPYLDGQLKAAPSSWPKPSRTTSDPFPVRRTATSNLYVLATAELQALAEKWGEHAKTLGYKVVHLSGLDDPAIRRVCEQVGPGDWVLLAGSTPPNHWHCAFGRQPDKFPRRLLLAADEAVSELPALLRLVPTLPLDADAAVCAWLGPPTASLQFALVPDRAAWEQLAKRAHDRLAVDFSLADPLLRYVDPRIRSLLVAMFARTWAFAIGIHVAAGALTWSLRLQDPQLSRAHLVTTLSCLLLVDAFIAIRSVGVALLVATYGALGSATAVLAAGRWFSDGVPACAAAAGVVLGVSAVAQSVLSPAHRRIREGIGGPMARAVVAGAFLLAPVLIGAVVLLAFEPLDRRSCFERLALGTLLGMLGGATVGGVIAYVQARLYRKRDRSRLKPYLVRSCLVCTALVAPIVALDNASPESWADASAIGLFVGALMVVFTLGPTGIVRVWIPGRWAPLVGCLTAVIALVPLTRIFNHPHHVEWILPLVVAGAIVGGAGTLGAVHCAGFARAVVSPRRRQGLL